MRAAVVEAVGSPPGRPRSMTRCASDGSALVAVEAAPLNPVEIRVAAGRHPGRREPPYVPGLEGAGTVVESDRLPPGTRVRFEGAPCRASARRARSPSAPPCRRSRWWSCRMRSSDDLAAAVGVVGITALLALERAAPAGGRAGAGAGSDGRGRPDGGPAREERWERAGSSAPAAAPSGLSAFASSAPTRSWSWAARTSPEASSGRPAGSSTSSSIRSGESPRWRRFGRSPRRGDS